MIARGAGLEPARTRDIGRKHAADVAAGGAAEQRRIVHRLKGELLPLEATSASISPSDVPALAESTSSSGS